MASSSASGSQGAPFSSPSELTAELARLTASEPSSSRASAYTAVLRSSRLLGAPRSALPASRLVPLAAAYIAGTALADANTSGAGVVVGRQALALFDHALREAAAAAKGDGGKADSMNVDAAEGEEDRAAPAIVDLEVRREILQVAVESLRPRTQVFEEQIAQLRIHLAELLEEEEDWLEAAKALAGIPTLDSSGGSATAAAAESDSGAGGSAGGPLAQPRAMTDLDRFDMYVHIARLYLEADDTVQADVYLKRASHLLSIAQAAASSSASRGAAPDSKGMAKATPQMLVLMYKLSQARIYDAQRRFLEASLRFHELSYIGEIDEAERMQMLSAAVTAAILAPAGPQRSRVLSALVRDERTRQLDAQRSILSKVFLDHLIRPAEVAQFNTLLAPHQRAAIVPSANDKAMFDMADAEAAAADPSAPRKRHGPATVLDRAMMEHNVLAASRLYTTITLAGLGALLDVSVLGAETIARRMIQQRRLAAEIDQGASDDPEDAGVLIFREDARAGVIGADGGAGGELASNVAVNAAGGGGGDGKDGGGAGEAGPDGDADGAAEDQLDPDAIYTKRWDAHIARTAARLEDVYQRLLKQGAVSSAPVARA